MYSFVNGVGGELPVTAEITAVIAKAT